MSATIASIGKEGISKKTLTVFSSDSFWRCIQVQASSKDMPGGRMILVPSRTTATGVLSTGWEGWPRMAFNAFSTRSMLAVLLMCFLMWIVFWLRLFGMKAVRVKAEDEVQDAVQ